MMYYDTLNIIKDFLQWSIFIVMLFIFIFGAGYKIVSLTVGGIALVSLLFINTTGDWSNSVIIAGRLDLLCAILLIASMGLRLHDKAKNLAKSQSVLLFFASIAHVMVAWSVRANESSLLYLCYDELIILIGIIQLWVCYGAILGAFRNIRRFVYSSFFMRLGYNASIPQRNHTKNKQ